MNTDSRLNILFVCFFLAAVTIAARLFYWQVIDSSSLTLAAENQHWVSLEIPAKRGEILFRDGYPLVSNSQSFLLYASIPILNDPPSKISGQIASIIADPSDASVSANLEDRLTRQDLVWVPLKHGVSLEAKQKIEDLNITGVGFEPEGQRGYPEGSIAAHLTGFVGSDVDGKDKGYFGLEGYYDLELKGQAGLLRREKDPLGKPILIGEVKEEKSVSGRNLVTTIDRSVQYIVDQKLTSGIIKYGAKSGTVILMDPASGEILAMDSKPNYDQKDYWNYDQSLYSNPAISMSFEPGSIFKVLVMSAALDSGAVKPEMICTFCYGPKQISDYTINTWNDKYYANSTMVEVIQHSDNVGMVFAAQKVGLDKLYTYLQNFGIGTATGIDLEEESVPSMRAKKDWTEIDLATASFGQGIAVTPLQMVKAVGALANQGKMVRPFIVKKVISDDKTTQIEPKLENQVIKSSTAKVITEMMINAVDNGEAKFAKPLGYRIAGKTGTAQIPIAGHYDATKTIASFIGFAPADNPKFVMLVTLNEPSSSQWGSETAAPLWFDIARELFHYWGISPTY